MFTTHGEIRGDLYRLITDKEIANKLILCRSQEECFKVVSDRLEGMSLAEFAKEMRIIKSCFEENTEGLLTVEELDIVSGGAAKGMEICALSCTDSKILAAAFRAAI